MEFDILPSLSKYVPGIPSPFHYETIFMVSVVTGALIVLFYLLTRRLRASDRPPGRAQALAEIIVEAFDKLVEASMGKKRARKYLPFIGTLFFFVLFCNMIGLVPVPLLGHVEIGGESYTDWNDNHTYDSGEPFEDANGDGVRAGGFVIHKFEEPTKNLNVPLGLAVLFLIIVHCSAIKIRGIKEYLWEYASPAFVIGGRKIPNLPMLPLNIVGELGKAISLPFRLFGNIFGGAVILTLAFTASAPYLFFPLPLGLNFFFGVFVGTVQAFVFTMLAMTYIVVAVGEE